MSVQSYSAPFHPTLQRGAAGAVWALMSVQSYSAPFHPTLQRGAAGAVWARLCDLTCVPGRFWVGGGSGFGVDPGNNSWLEFWCATPC